MTAATVPTPQGPVSARGGEGLQQQMRKGWRVWKGKRRRPLPQVAAKALHRRAAAAPGEACAVSGLRGGPLPMIALQR